MGYELKIMVGRKSKDTSNVYRARIFDVLASVDLCQLSARSKIKRLAMSSRDLDDFVYIQGQYGNIVLSDMYANEFNPVPVETVLDALIEDFQKYHYKRFEWAIGLLSKMVNDNLSVIFYGH